jgi:hypothetical protein
MTLQAYVLLSFGIEEHIAGYVDAYFEPVEWRKETSIQKCRVLYPLSFVTLQLLPWTPVAGCLAG